MNRPEIACTLDPLYYPASLTTGYASLPTMSSTPAHRIDGSTKFETHRQFAAIARRKLFEAVQLLGFWTAIALPFTYLPLLYQGSLTPTSSAFAAVVALNVLAVLVGHGHDHS